jgi:hypothetical protein
MSYPNYLNGIPSSLVGYGNQRQQFQSYDGVLSTASRVDDANLDTLEKQVTILDEKVTSLTTTLAGYNILPGSTGTLSVANLIAINTETTSAAIGTSIVKTLNINPTDGTGIVMNDRMIKFRTGADTNHGIQYIYDAGRGFDGLDVFGYKGGALGFKEGVLRKACMDWGSERIRSVRTFQAGRVTTNATTGTISFSSPYFKTTPSVVASVYGGNGTNNLFQLRIYNVTQTSFQYDKKYTDGAGTIYDAGTEYWGWVAFDPTDTSIF